MSSKWSFAQVEEAADVATGRSCQVAGCATLPAALAGYNARCRLCTPHMRASVVDSDGTAKRFCQK